MPCGTARPWAGQRAPRQPEGRREPLGCTAGHGAGSDHWSIRPVQLAAHQWPNPGASEGGAAPRFTHAASTSPSSAWGPAPLRAEEQSLPEPWCPSPRCPHRCRTLPTSWSPVVNTRISLWQQPRQLAPPAKGRWSLRISWPCGSWRWTQQERAGPHRCRHKRLVSEVGTENGADQAAVTHGGDCAPMLG